MMHLEAHQNIGLITINYVIKKIETWAMLLVFHNWIKVGKVLGALKWVDAFH
jgi:hypothetical protein